MNRKLHIGGQVKAAGLEVLDANPGPKKLIDGMRF
jgi:hypothetical protein